MDSNRWARGGVAVWVCVCVVVIEVLMSIMVLVVVVVVVIVGVLAVVVGEDAGVASRRLSANCCAVARAVLAR